MKLCLHMTLPSELKINFIIPCKCLNGKGTKFWKLLITFIISVVFLSFKILIFLGFIECPMCFFQGFCVT